MNLAAAVPAAVPLAVPELVGASCPHPLMDGSSSRFAATKDSSPGLLV